MERKLRKESFKSMELKKEHEYSTQWSTLIRNGKLSVEELKGKEFRVSLTGQLNLEE